MKFAATSRVHTDAVAEARLGRFAAVLLGSSVLLLFAFFLAAAGAITQQWFALPGFAFLVAVIAQVHFLSKIGRYQATKRRQIWLLSLAVHLVLLTAIPLYFQSLSALVLVVPELASTIVHLFGLRHASARLATGA